MKQICNSILIFCLVYVLVGFGCSKSGRRNTASKQDGEPLSEKTTPKSAPSPPLSKRPKINYPTKIRQRKVKRLLVLSQIILESIGKCIKLHCPNLVFKVLSKWGRLLNFFYLYKNLLFSFRNFDALLLTLQFPKYRNFQLENVSPFFCYLTNSIF